MTLRSHIWAMASLASISIKALPPAFVQITFPQPFMP
jgi:hypothetical protein